MLDEKLNALIEKYGIYDAIGGLVPLKELNRFWYKLWSPFLQLEGIVRLVWALNAALRQVAKDDSVALWLEGRSRGLIWFWVLLPSNKKKIHFLIKERKDSSDIEYHGRPVLDPGDVVKVAPINAVVVASWQSEKSAYLIDRHFKGKVIDFNMLAYDKNLTRYFVAQRKENPYADIFISRYHLENESGIQRKVWHKRLIANYVRARDFLNVKREIEAYSDCGYEDGQSYIQFWKNLEAIFLEIKKTVKERKQRDVFIYWLDQMEKEDFFSMKWVGMTNNGMVFQNAYTTMTNTTAVMRSIFTGKNVKNGKLMNLKKLKLSETVFSEYPSQGKSIRFFSNVLRSKLDDAIGHSFYKFCLPDTTIPAMIGNWYALNALMNSEEEYVFFVHCMETHTPFECGEIAEWETAFAPPQIKDYSNVAKLSRDYLDEELKWYDDFAPKNSIRIFMSDHGNEQNCSEENINMPFKIIGKDFKASDEFRLFSYVDMYKLLEVLCGRGGNENSAFRQYVMMDVIDPYDPSYGQGIRGMLWNHFLFERKEVERNILKKYLQTTKIVTTEGEYYTINILGEETYYNDKACKINLANNPAYTERVAELREKAGKFYNPWKEKRQVAINFYEYLGIEEKDIIVQCF